MNAGNTTAGEATSNGSSLLPLMEIFAAYFDGEVRDFDHLPDSGPVLLVGNHSGGTITPDTTVLIAHWYRERGLDAALYGLAFDAMFGLPGVSTLMSKIGHVPASPRNARAVLDRGASLIIYPGGDREVFRPWTDRNRIDFGGRKGFVRLALESGVPVVPVVGHGGHDSTIVLTRGDRIAEFFRLDRVRSSTFPILFQIPWGVSPGGWPAVPLPAKVVVQCCEPLDWSGYGKGAAEDPEVLERCYEEITGIMQDTLSEMASERPCPVASRVASLVTAPIDYVRGWTGWS